MTLVLFSMSQEDLICKVFTLNEMLYEPSARLKLRLLCYTLETSQNVYLGLVTLTSLSRSIGCLNVIFLKTVEGYSSVMHEYIIMTR